MSKKFAVRVRTTKSRDWKAVHLALGGKTFVRVHAQGQGEFILTTDSQGQMDELRTRFSAAALEEIVGGDTTAVAPPSPTATAKSKDQRHTPASASGNRAPVDRHAQTQPPGITPLPGKPYGFVPLPSELTTLPPVWHDGVGSADRVSGEIRLELEALTPLLVGWERQAVNEAGTWAIPHRRLHRAESRRLIEAAAAKLYPASDDRREFLSRLEGKDVVNVSLSGIGTVLESKCILAPLRADWGARPVVIPGDTLKGLLRQELGALLGAPMERVAERTYSYRPNALFPKDPRPRLVARIARIPADGVGLEMLSPTVQVRVPNRLELMPVDILYDKESKRSNEYYRFDSGRGGTYRGGLGAGDKLNSKRWLHSELQVETSKPSSIAEVSSSVREGYLQTLRHLVDEDHGHFSARHPDAEKFGRAARNRILRAAQEVVFQPGDFIWVEWDKDRECIVSLGWHYYYRWAYTDSVRRTGGTLERLGLFPLPRELEKDADGAPLALSPVRRMFGYTGDNDGSAGIGNGAHSQLMGRIAINAALEVVSESENSEQRFLKPVFLKELGNPRPSAVEFYLKQPYHPGHRPSDQASLVTYGDAAGYDAPGELAGRKFYLDRRDAYAADGKALVPGPVEDASDANRFNFRSTLAFEASRPGRRFRFTLRFRDLERAELAAVLLALCPDQFRSVLGGTHAEGYCSKLGYARPLGWGSVRIEAKDLLLLNTTDEKPSLEAQRDLVEWVRKHHEPRAMQSDWLAIHRRRHPDAKDYPRGEGGKIYSVHTQLRATHSRQRRYRHKP